MKYLIHAMLILALGFICVKASAKDVVYEDNFTQTWYEEYTSTLSEYEPGTDSYEELNTLLKEHFIIVSYPNYDKISMSDSLRNWLNNEGPYPYDED